MKGRLPREKERTRSRSVLSPNFEFLGKVVVKSVTRATWHLLKSGCIGAQTRRRPNCSVRLLGPSYPAKWIPRCSWCRSGTPRRRVGLHAWRNLDRHLVFSTTSAGGQKTAPGPLWGSGSRASNILAGGMSNDSLHKTPRQPRKCGPKSSAT